MLDTAEIDDLKFTAARAEHRKRGLYGWLKLRIGGIWIDGVTLRRTLRGRLALSWPARKDGRGQLHHHVWPVNDAVRRQVERRVFELLGRELIP